MVQGAGARHRLEAGAKGDGRVYGGVFKTAGQRGVLHQSSPRTMVKKSTLVVAARAARWARAAWAAASSGAKTVARTVAAWPVCISASISAAWVAWVLSRPCT